MKKISILFILLLSTSFSSLAWSSENYEDCIFKNMKGIGSDLGAKEIIDLCKAKHINTKPSICFEIDAQTINGIIFLQDINEPYTGKNLCKYTNGQVKSSVADRSQGPGIDPTSRFSYVYTGKHDHGQLESEVSRRDSDKWTGLSDAMSHMKRHCDSHLTNLLAQQEEAAKPQETSTSTSSSSSSKK